jgi:hypothetical protein
MTATSSYSSCHLSGNFSKKSVKHATIFFFNDSTALVGPGRYFGFLIYLRAVGLLGRVISSSQGLYLNTRQHKHRKTHIHTIKHPCPRRDSNPQSLPPSDRRLFMPQTAQLPRPAHATITFPIYDYPHVFSCGVLCCCTSDLVEVKEQRTLFTEHIFISAPVSGATS